SRLPSRSTVRTAVPNTDSSGGSTDRRTKGLWSRIRSRRLSMTCRRNASIYTTRSGSSGTWRNSCTHLSLTANQPRRHCRRQNPHAVDSLDFRGHSHDSASGSTAGSAVLECRFHVLSAGRRLDSNDEFPGFTRANPWSARASDAGTIAQGHRRKTDVSNRDSGAAEDRGASRTTPLQRRPNRSEEQTHE